VYDNYNKRTGKDERTRLPAWNDLKREVLSQLLDPTNGLPFAARAVLRTQLRMPAETAPTNAAPNAIEGSSTNLITPAAVP